MKISIKLILVILASILNFNCNTNQQPNNTTSNKNSVDQTIAGKRQVLTPLEFKEKSLNHTIVDIRTGYEYKRGHIKGSININYYQRNFLDNFANFDKNEPIYIYCRSGNRTSPASKKLLKSGFKEIYDLRGGILNWEKNKNQIVK